MGKRQELESILKHLSADFELKKQTEDQLRQRINKLQDERKTLAERVTGLQRAVQTLASEKQQEHKDLKRHARENNKLKRTIDGIEREKEKSDQAMLKTGMDKQELEGKILSMGQELKDSIDTAKKLEMQLENTKKLYEKRMLDQSERFKREMELEMDRFRVVSMQNERTLEARETAHQQRIACLEDTCDNLREHVGRTQRESRRKHRQTAELLADIRRATSPARTSPVKYT